MKWSVSARKMETWRTKMLPHRGKFVCHRHRILSSKIELEQDGEKRSCRGFFQSR